MNTPAKKDADVVDTKLEISADIGQESFEVEDITDLNLYAPLESLCSSTSSCSSCCS